MEATLCSSARAALSPNENLVSLLQDSISCVADDAFHAVLYQALSGLHEYIGSHHQKLLVQGLPSKAPNAGRQWKKPRPSFWRVTDSHSTSSNNKGIVTYGWMEEMISRSEGRGSVLLDEVILLLVAPKKEEPYLRICQEIISDNSPPQMETRNRAPLRSLIIDYEEVFGDPRLVLTTEEGETITLRCGSSLSAQSWVLEIQRILKEDALRTCNKPADEPDPEILNQSVEVERDENDTDIVHEIANTDKKKGSTSSSPTAPSKQDAEEKIQELESPILTPKSTTSSTLSTSSEAQKDMKDKPPQTPPPSQEGTQPVVKKQPQMVSQPIQKQAPQSVAQVAQQKAHTAAQTAPIRNSPKPQQAQPPTKQQHSSQQGPQVAQAQAQARLHQVSQQQQKLTQQQQQRPQQQQQQHRMQQQQAKVAPPTPTTQIGKEMLVEQQKKLAAERRKQDLESQRKLAREEQKGKDLQAKRKFLEKEQRKQELVAKNQRPNASNDTSANLKQITQQMAEIDAEIRQVAIRADAIKKEIEQRKNQPLQMPTVVQQPTPGATAAAQRRLDEQARREQDLEAKKKAAIEKRRRELEEQRRKAREEQKRKEDLKKQRFLEQEKRKQDLMAKAKQGRVETNDSALFQKLSNQISGLDAEAERKREEQATKAKEEAEAADPEIARQRIAEGAKQKELQDEMKRTSNHASGMGQGPSIGLAQSGSSEMGQGSRVSLAQSGSSDMGQGSRVSLAQSGSSEDGGFGNSWDQQQQQQRHPAFNSSVSSHDDPFEHLQAPEQTRYPHQSMRHQSVPQQSIPNPSPRYGMPPHPQYPHMHPHIPRGGATQYSNNMAPPSPSSPHYYPSNHHQQAQYPFQHPTHNQMYHTVSTPQPQPPQPQPAPAPVPASVQPTPQPQPQQPDPVMNSKYAANGDDDEDDDQSAQTELKRKIIVCWGLQPPEMQGLRQINELLCTIQTVFPPANDLPAHQYFSGWKAIPDSELREGPGLDEKKLSKAVRKLRFFLHPDKLPRDLTNEQQFVCKLLWDITNDAWADYKKALEDLDWM